MAYRMGWVLLSVAVTMGAAGCGDDEDTSGQGASGPGTTSNSGGAGGEGGAGGAAAVDILEALEAIEGMTVVEQESPVGGTRSFSLEYDQPANHGDPDGPRFQQRLTLLHRSVDAPTVLYSSGYHLDDQPSEITEILEANQLSVEHRFFSPSSPEPPTWADLTIEQSATDYHRIVTALKPIYERRWISTGHSKGGMTSVYFRRFFPDDVDATVAYVAPHSLGENDDRYPAFLDTVGDDVCHARLEAFQREVLLRRPAMLALLQDSADQRGVTFDFLGLEMALEHAAIEAGWGFWQFGGEAACPLIPDSSAVDDEIFQGLEQLAYPSYFFSDEGLQRYLPYYYQAATELGYAAPDEAHLLDLLQFPGTDIPPTYVPAGVPVAFDPGAMPDISGWLGSEGSALMFIYGEDDPWSGGAFDITGAEDSYRFIVPGGNHGALIANLPEPDRTQALEALGGWSGVTPMMLHGAPAPARRDPFALTRFRL